VGVERTRKRVVERIRKRVVERIRKGVVERIRREVTVEADVAEQPNEEGREGSNGGRRRRGEGGEGVMERKCFSDGVCKGSAAAFTSQRHYTSAYLLAKCIVLHPECCSLAYCREVIRD
jgi:hypothetical protein